nr:hypothetical protein [Clostridia bacterium]
MSEKMDWRERTYYWVRLNLSDISWFKTGHDGYGKNYERRVRELKKIPELKMHPLPSMALAREKREKVPRWAQMLVSCRKAHDKTLVNTLESFKADWYGYCEWERVAEPKKGEKRKMEVGEKIEAGDLVRVLDGSGIKDYCGGWIPPMDMFVGRVFEVNRVVNDPGWTGRGVKLEYGGGYTWDTRGLELVTKCKVRPEAETVEAKAFKIRNSAGVLTVRAERELSLRDVFHGMGDDKLPAMKRPRLEIHSGGNHWGGMLVTLSDRDDDDKGMYVIEIPADYDGGKPRAWLGRYDTEQPEDAYVTMEPWREG